jgi:uncharacterized protein YjbJ (UPF0337 family)
VGERASELRRPEGGVAAAAAVPTVPETGESPETAALRDDIEQTRAEMTGTIDAIQEKLDPEVLQEQAKDTIREAKAAAVEVVDHAITQAKQAVRGATLGKVEDMARYAEDTAGGWRDTLVETVKAHPIPAALAGLSLGYLLLNREHARSRTRTTRHGGVIEYRPQEARNGSEDAGAYRRLRAVEPDADGEPSVADRAGAVAGRMQETAGAVAGQARDTAGQAAGQLQDTAGQVAGQVQETAGQVADQVQETAHRAQGFLSRQLEENPLAVGAVAVVLGGALGATIGTTPREDRLFGDARDRLMGRAQEVTQQTLGQVEERVGRVVDEVKDTAGRAADELKGTAEREARAQDLLPQSTPAGPRSPQSRPGGDGASPLV